MGSDFGALFDLAWKLLLVLGLAVLATRVLKWLSGPALGTDSVLKVVTRLPVGPQQSLVLVSVGKKRLLVGQSSQQLTLLTELAPEDLAVEPADQGVPARRTPRQKTLLDVFFALLERSRAAAWRSRRLANPPSQKDSEDAGPSEAEVALARRGSPLRALVARLVRANAARVAASLPEKGDTPSGDHSFPLTSPSASVEAPAVDPTSEAASVTPRFDDRASIDFVIKLQHALAAYSRQERTDAPTFDRSTDLQMALPFGKLTAEIRSQ